MSMNGLTGDRSGARSISALVHRYSDAVVHQDERQWSATWAEDATWELPGGRTVVGKAAIVEMWRTSLSKYSVVVQTTSNGEVIGSRGRWYITEHFKKKNGDVGILLAHYDDEYVEVGGRWLFAKRALTIHYQGPPNLTGRFPSDQPADLSAERSQP
jgi:hypothetical protein